jgi:hypothetical protein
MLREAFLEPPAFYDRRFPVLSGWFSRQPEIMRGIHHAAAYP